MIYVIETQWHERTLKEYLFSGLSLSRAQVTALKKKERGILLNGLHVTVRALLKEGDRLELALEDEASAEDLVPFEADLEILYEDEDLVCVNKEKGMPTHPSRGHFEDRLANALAAYYLKRGRPFVFRAVNRLDRDTTGVVLIAKNKRAAAALSEQISERRVEKEYIALLCGSMEEDCGDISKNILRVQGSMMLRRTDDVLGEKALTSYRVVERKKGMTLVLATPHTGRTHQLRVHFSSIGHPIFADSLYGTASPDLEGQALHAYRLSFAHPVTGKPLTVTAPLKPDFLKVLKDYGFEVF
jgi:23S rRNA pseudouridine1911/1915/1917 synthase